MENKIVTAIFKDSTHTKVSDVWQYDYGQILRIQGLDLPTAVEVDFAVAGASESIARIGTTKDGVTDVVIPDSLIETGKNLVAYIYLRDSASGNTEYQIDMLVTKRAKPEAYDRPEDKELFGQAIEAVNTAADRAEKAGQAATEAAGQAAEDAQQTAEDRKEVAKMVETVSGISEQVKKVEELSQKAQEAATKAGKSEQAADGFKTQAESAKKGAEAAAVKTAEDKTAVDNAKTEVLEAKTEVNADRTVVEQVKNEVEQLGGSIAGAVQSGVQEITQAGTAQKTAVEAAGTQAVESVENVKASATEAVETVKTEAIQAVQEEGTTQTGNVTAEGTKQVKAVQDKGTEVLQSIPEDFTAQMSSKLDKNQGAENAGKALVIGEDGSVVPGKPQTEGAGDGADAIVNTASGEVISVFDSADRKNKGFRMTGNTEQMSTRGVNLFDEKLLLDFDSENYDKTQSGSGFYYYKFPVSGTVTVSTKNANKNGEYLTVGIKPDGSDKTWLSHGTADISKYKTLTPEDGNIYLGVNNNLERVKSMIQNTGGIIINEGSAAQPYEPYTGNKPSPSPEYPQEIKNVGKWNEETQKYEVDVKITGKNLLNLQKEPDVKGIYQGWKVGNGELLTLGVKDKGNNADIKGCYIGFSDQGSESKGVVWVVDNGVIKTNPLNQRKAYVSIFPANETTVKKLTERFDIQCELGNVATTYQPYKEQTLTLTSDRPITKWDRLVEQGGEIGWLYKSKIVSLTGGEEWETSLNAFYTTTYNFIKNYEAKCSHYVLAGITNQEKNNIFSIGEGTYTNSLWIRDTSFSAVQDFKAHLSDLNEKGDPIMVVSSAAETEFVPLPQSEQNAIRNLTTYYPSTTLTNDQGCVMELDYVADTKLYIDNKVSAKVASIISQYQLNTANLLSLMPMETQAAMIENDTNNILNNLESEETQ